GIGCRKSTWNDAEINKTIPYYHKLEMLHENALTLPQTPIWPKVTEFIDQMLLKAIETEIPSRILLEITQHNIEKICDIDSADLPVVQASYATSFTNTLKSTLKNNWGFNFGPKSSDEEGKRDLDDK
ncbi:MAG: hypothetical protein RR444_09320, partial [Oscillospiraceae bacterium]